MTTPARKHSYYSDATHSNNNKNKNSSYDNNNNNNNNNSNNCVHFRIASSHEVW